VPVHVLKHFLAPSYILEVAVEGEIVGDDDFTRRPDLGDLLAIQPLVAVVGIGAAIVEVTAAVRV
jgi:hypothetical protein